MENIWIRDPGKKNIPDPATHCNAGDPPGLEVDEGHVTHEPLLLQAHRTELALHQHNLHHVAVLSLILLPPLRTLYPRAAYRSLQVFCAGRGPPAAHRLAPSERKIHTGQSTLHECFFILVASATLLDFLFTYDTDDDIL